MWWKILRGNAMNIPLADSSVHCVVTSPPYWGLRDYGVEGQLGMETTPEQYVEHMVEVFREVRRVLRDDGTLWLNLGDSYTSGGREGHGTRVGYKQQTNRGMSGTCDPVRAPQPPGLKPKDLVGIPWRVAFALQADGWWLRSDIVWAKPNPMPESVTDRPTKAHEYLFLLAKSQTYFYDHEAVKEPSESGPSDRRKMEESLPRIGGKHKDLDDPLSSASAATNIGRKRAVGDPAGRNRRTVWNIATSPFKGAHFATFPPKLVEPCIKAGTSEYGCCPECGAPWRRVVEKGMTAHDGETDSAYAEGTTANRLARLRQAARERGGEYVNQTRTTGWQPTCACEAGIVPCTVLDPFSGAGTTVLVANRLGRNAIGIELNSEYVEMARQRIIADAPLFAEAVL